MFHKYLIVVHVTKYIIIEVIKIMTNDNSTSLLKKLSVKKHIDPSIEINEIIEPMSFNHILENKKTSFSPSSTKSTESKCSECNSDTKNNVNIKILLSIIFVSIILITIYLRN